MKLLARIPRSHILSIFNRSYYSVLAKQNTMAEQIEFKRIPYTVNPKNYNISFTPNFAKYTFTGQQTVSVDVKEVTDTVVLNVKDVQVSEVSFGNLTGSATIDEQREQVGSGELKMKFQGKHNDLMKGFYRSEYKTSSGEIKYNLCTQFEPEINRKPVATPDGLPELSDGAHYDLVTFSQTPIMSTYLLAMVVGHFDFVECQDANGVRIRVYTPVGKIHTADFAMKVAKDALPFYAKCFGIAYPLPKMDLIALPDFAAGAMENWGLVTYRETALLIDAKESSMALRQRVALVVAHELAHMWFGNLVTMKWWTHLWLNEGFATWMEYLCVQKVLPEYDIWTEFADSEQSSAFKLDGLRSSHPIEVEVKGPEEVDEIFDTISYAKGASIINMLYHFIGDEAFFNGLKSYIAKFQYSNAYTEDLWDAFSSASGKPIRDIMSNWTQTMGYPVVSVRTENSTANGVDVVLTQSRFLSDGTVEEGEQSKWAVPVTICEADDNSKVLGKVLMPVDGKPVSVHLEKNVPFRLNPGRVSFYRVMYDTPLLSGIMEAVKNGKVGPRDRISLIDDQFSLAFSGKQSLHSALEFSKAFAGEPHHVVWSNLAVILRHVRLLIEEIAFRNIENSGKVPDIIEKSDPERSLDKLYQLLASPVFEKIGWHQENESYNDTMLRPIILSILAKSDYAPVVKEANIRFQKHYDHIMQSKGDTSKDNDVISPDIRTTIYGCAMRNNDEAVYKQLINLYEAASMQDERVRILASLGVAKQSELRSRTLQYAVSPEVRKQDRFRCLISVNGSGPLGRRALWGFVQNRIELLPEDLGSQALLSYVLKSACSDFICKSKHREIKEFFDKHPVPCKRAINQSLESVAINASQVERDAAGILKFLASL